MGVEDLSRPEGEEQLYADWGESSPSSRPIMQGDVFDHVTVPGLGAEPRTVQVIMHPCTMRRGATLRERITVIPVVPYQEIGSSAWNGHAKVMLLPKLRGPEDRFWAADFCEPVSVLSEQLAIRKRVVSLSNEGVLILQQRLIFFHTRFSATLDDLHALNAPIFTELELQEDWVEQALDFPHVEPDEDTVMDQAIKDFHAWLDDDGRSRRAKLEVPREHSALSLNPR